MSDLTLLALIEKADALAAAVEAWDDCSCPGRIDLCPHADRMLDAMDAYQAARKERTG